LTRLWLRKETRQAVHIEEGFLQAERGELIDGTQARREIQTMKDNWHQERASKSVPTLAPDLAALSVSCNLSKWLRGTVDIESEATRDPSHSGLLESKT
jgi:hypothetical protein